MFSDFWAILPHAHLPPSTCEIKQSRQDEMQRSYSFIWFIKRREVTKWEEDRSNIIDPYENLQASLLIFKRPFQIGAVVVFKKIWR